jgi:hypothetical protein
VHESGASGQPIVLPAAQNHCREDHGRPQACEDRAGDDADRAQNVGDVVENGADLGTRLA